MSVNVLIVGAGPTGLSLALSLLRNGLSVRIIEKQLQFHPGERGAGIQSRTLEIYKFLGILPDLIEQSATSPRNLQYYSAPDDGKPPRFGAFAEPTEDTPARPLHNARMLGQNRHEALVRKHILADYGCQVELGTELRSFEQHHDHVVAHVIRTVNSKQVEETIIANWLVGADGARSVVRTQLGLSFLGESPPAVEAVTGDIYVLGDSVKQDHPDGWLIWGHPSSLAVSLRPCLVPGQNLFNFYILGGPEHGIDMSKVSSNREELIKVFYDITGRKDIKFGELVWMGLWRPNIRMVDSFGKDRVFVAGDAAHVHSPTGGQGMNSGVQDSFNLAWKLALVHKGLAPKSLLDSYSQERMPVIAAMLNKTTELFRKEFQGKLGQREDLFRGYELRQLGVNYRGSPFVVDERYTEKDEVVDPYRSGDDGTVHAGDRAPDAPGLTRLDGEITALFDIFKPVQHTALIFPGLAGQEFVAETLEALREYPTGIVKSVLLLPASSAPSSFPDLADMVLVDSKGYAYTHYVVAQDTPTVVIVRPDGYIGALVTSGKTGIRTYFADKVLL
ncbi:hypothetical protein BT96DRAFT_876700 [Gymnopus androsaceus JB14]|uniref:FAD-binding domain-containing protein n=1 Tax=Gymnopus androsaceus JB14 TaxID=1447944 RepID=A0A6A4I3R5_9AGAR|nr:hypothetical protein BT96DRAFT_876700 [Gymnopus androsaceus JB14]